MILTKNEQVQKPVSLEIEAYHAECKKHNVKHQITAMQIPLNRFDEYIDDTILKRGLEYFRKGKVHEPEETGPGEYEAIVEGTEDYTVRLVVANEVVTEHDF